MSAFHPDKHLPGCMMPDGGDCCSGYAAVCEDWHRQRATISRLTEERDGLDEWLKVYDAYYAASEIYNKRVYFIREQEAAGRFGEFNAHGEYKLLTEAQRATFAANTKLYETLRGLLPATPAVSDALARGPVIPMSKRIE